MKFILTKELGRLAKWLRILGFDAEYMQEHNPSALIIKALRDERVILTRNHRLPQVHGAPLLVLQEERIKAQVAEVLRRLHITPDSAMMLTRCTLCNTQLDAVAKDKIQHKVPAYVFETQHNFMSCPSCGRVYWQGTHWDGIRSQIEGVLAGEA